MKHRPKTVEKLERGEDLALYQHSRHDCCGRPPARAGWHFEPPLFYWEAAERAAAFTSSSAQHGGHGWAGAIRWSARFDCSVRCVVVSSFVWTAVDVVEILSVAPFCRAADVVFKMQAVRLFFRLRNVCGEVSPAPSAPRLKESLPLKARIKRLGLRPMLSAPFRQFIQC